jgi:ectoine hydroxylase-related dioxygenase (phytanoyl-CoA dioxygenase family)
MEEGDLIIFPSHLAHKGNDNHTDENRICFAYNFLPSRSTQFEVSQPPWYLDQNQLVNSFKD